jgi:hypothetical protein
MFSGMGIQMEMSATLYDSAHCLQIQYGGLKPEVVLSLLPVSLLPVSGHHIAFAGIERVRTMLVVCPVGSLYPKTYPAVGIFQLSSLEAEL